MKERRLLSKVFLVSSVAFAIVFFVLRILVGKAERPEAIFVMAIYSAVLLPPIFFPAFISGLLLASNIIASKIFKIANPQIISYLWTKIVLLVSFLMVL